MRSAFIKLHLSVLLAGCTGLFGALIQLNETEIVWFRMLLASVLMLCLFGVPKRVTLHQFLGAAVSGAVLAVHWMLFYCSIKVSNVCIGVLCFSLTSVWTAVLEPLFGHRKPSAVELLLSVLTVAGIASIYLLSPDSATQQATGVDVQRGVTIGVVSSFFCALYVILSKRCSEGMRTRDFLQCSLSGGLVLTTLIIPLYLAAFALPVGEAMHRPTWVDFGWMLCHASFCTVGMYMLQLAALRKLSAFTVNLTYNLEPVYSIIFAIVLLGEGTQLNYGFYIGLGLIILSVLLQSLFVSARKTSLLRLPHKPHWPWHGRNKTL